MQTLSVESPQRSVLADVLCQWTAFCASAAWLVIAATVVPAAGCLYFAYHHFQMADDRAEQASPLARLIHARDRQEKAASNPDQIAFVVEGKRREKIEAAMDDLAARLAELPEQVDLVWYKTGADFLSDRQLQTLPPDLLAEGLDRLESYGPILEGNWERISLAETVTRLTSQLSRKKTDPAAEAQLLHHADLLTSSLTTLIDHPQADIHPWPELIPITESVSESLTDPVYLMNDSGTVGFVVGKLVPANSAANKRTKSIAELRNLAKDVRRQHQELRISLTGPEVLADEEWQGALSDSTWAWAASVVSALLLLVWGLRSVQFTFVALVTLTVGLAWTLGLATYAVGHFNPLSMAAPGLLVGLGSALIARFLIVYLHLRTQQRLPYEALVDTVGQIGVSTVAAALMMSIGLFSLVLINLPSVTEFALVSGSGVALLGLATLTVLPATVAAVDLADEIEPEPKPVPTGMLYRAISERPSLAFVASAICLIVTFAQTLDWSHGLPTLRVVYDPSVTNSFSKNLEASRIAQRASRSSALPWIYAESVAQTPEEVQNLRERFEQLDTVETVQEVATFMPEPVDKEVQQLLRGLHAKLTRLPEEPPELRAINPANVGVAFEGLVDQLKTRTDLVAKKIVKSVNSFLDHLDPLSAKDQMALLADFEGRMSNALLEQFKSLGEISNPEPITTEDLPPELAARFVDAKGQWLLRVYPKEDVRDLKSLERFVNDVRSIDADATGPAVRDRQAAVAIQRGYLICCSLATGAIIMVLIVMFGRWQAIVGSFAPAITVSLILVFLMQAKQIPFRTDLIAGSFVGVALVFAALFDSKAIFNSVISIIPAIIAISMSSGLLAESGIGLNAQSSIFIPVLLGIGASQSAWILHDRQNKAEGVRHRSAVSLNASFLAAILILGSCSGLLFSHHGGVDQISKALLLGVTASSFVTLVSLTSLLTMLSPEPPVEELELPTMMESELLVEEIPAEPNSDAFEEVSQPVPRPVPPPAVTFAPVLAPAPAPIPVAAVISIPEPEPVPQKPEVPPPPKPVTVQPALVKEPVHIS